MIDLPLLFGAVQPPPVTAPAACRRSHRMSDDGPKQAKADAEVKAHNRETRQAALLRLFAAGEISTGDLHLYTRWSYRILLQTLDRLQEQGRLAMREEVRGKVTCRFWRLA